MSFKYWPARNDIKKNYVNPTFQNQLWFIDILTVTKINLCSSKTNQNYLGDVIINKLRQSVKTITYPVNNGDTMQWSVNHSIWDTVQIEGFVSHWELKNR